VWEQGVGSGDTIQAAGYDAGPLFLGYRIPAIGTAGQPLYFSSSSIGVWSALEGTVWSFGDGSSASGANVSRARTYRQDPTKSASAGVLGTVPSVRATTRPSRPLRTTASHSRPSLTTSPYSARRLERYPQIYADDIQRCQQLAVIERAEREFTEAIDET
jgi:hypothetical protein